MKLVLIALLFISSLYAKDYLIGLQYATGTVTLDTEITDNLVATPPIKQDSSTQFDNGALLLAYKVDQQDRIELELAWGIKELESFKYNYQLLSYVIVNESPDIKGISMLLGLGVARLGMTYKAPFNVETDGIAAAMKLGISQTRGRHTLELGAKQMWFSPTKDVLEGQTRQGHEASFKFSNLTGLMYYVNYLYEL